MNAYLKSDLYRYYGKTGFLTLLKGYLTSRTIRWHVAFRLINSANLIEKMCGCVLWVLNRTRHMIAISHGAQIGYGLYIGHGGPVIVNKTAKIGDNCNLSPWTVIGSNSYNAATIGNNVYIGPSVCIVEDVVIGDNVTIGAGSVVTKSIPSNATAAGNYAKVLNYNNPSRYIHNLWLTAD